VRAYLDDPATRQLAEVFGAPVVIDANVRDGSLRQAVMERGIPMLLYEGGEALRFDRLSIRTGIRGIFSVMRRLGMLAEITFKKIKPTPLIARSSVWARAPRSGILRTKILLGDRVAKTEQLGIIADPFGENEAAVFSPAAGIVIGRSNMPLVHEGDAVFHIACPDKHIYDESMLQEFQEEMNRQDA
jgi:predicted deacylase